MFTFAFCLSMWDFFIRFSFSSNTRLALISESAVPSRAPCNCILAYACRRTVSCLLRCAFASTYTYEYCSASTSTEPCSANQRAPHMYSVLLQVLQSRTSLTISGNGNGPYFTIRHTQTAPVEAEIRSKPALRQLAISECLTDSSHFRPGRSIPPLIRGLGS